MAEEIETQRKVIPASEILAKIQNGEPVEYDNVVIDGDLDLSKLNLLEENVQQNNYQKIFNVLEAPKAIIPPIIIKNSLINGIINFSGINLKNETVFTGTTFREIAYFYNVQFTHVNFTSARFCSDVIFHTAHFRDFAFFDGTQFSCPTSFACSQFSCISYFGSAQFEGDVCFDRALFEQSSYFGYAEFSCPASFINTQFRGAALFLRAKFNTDADFSGTQFNRVDFTETQFNGDSLTFKESQFGDPVSQEVACRRAKRVLEESGKTEDADYHYFREMEARRIQKGVNPSDFFNGYFDYEMLLFDKFSVTTTPSFANFIKYNCTCLATQL